MAARRDWSYEETKAAFALYMALPPGQQSRTNPSIIALASAIDRSASSIALKLGNLKFLDPNRSGGLQNCSNMDRRIWQDYQDRGEDFHDEANQLYYELVDPETDNAVELLTSTPGVAVGFDRLTYTRERVNQNYFRYTLLENYDNRCCLTNISIEDLLVASHIKPWKDSTPTEKLDPANGLLLDALHDKAFDQGYITIDDQLRIRVSQKVPHNAANDRWIWAYDKAPIRRPRISPGRDYIAYHNDCIFMR
jgi:putative restriction endonuclease